jgi:ubiquinone/menaquinone biosynthesis C-methylase UbiE
MATSGPSSSPTAPAAERAAELLRPEHRDGPSWPADGYLDLLGDDTNADAADGEVPGTGLTQALMNTRVVPTIYERWWRPGLARVAKGVTGPGMAEEVRIARLLMGLSRGDKVLDVACGPGNFSREFARDAGEQGLVVGLDGSRTMLERGAEELRDSGLTNLALVRGDATALPFADGSFDGVCCFAALHLFADPFAALDEMTRVLRPGGRIALMASVRRQLTLPPLKPLIELTSGMRLFESGELTGALSERGFAEIHQRLAGMVQFVGGRLAADDAGG